MVNAVNNLNSQNVSTIATVVHNNAIPITHISDKDKQLCAILIGNEGNGLEDATVEACKIKTTIPMLSRAESLNASVAASISMWELLRR